MTRTHRILRATLVVLALAPAATRLAAQQANPSVASFGMGNNYTADAKGFEVVGWNPALLALAGQPKFSIGGLILGSAAGIGPITVSDFATYSDKTIPVAVRQGWVDKIRSGQDETGNLDGGMTFVALNWGTWAAQVSLSGALAMSANADAWETIFLGNANAVAQNRTLSPAGNVTGNGFVTSAVSWSRALDWKPTGRAGETFAIGLTGKYVLGVFDGALRDNGSTLNSTAVNLKIPVVYSTGTSAGNGIGLDVAAAWHAGNTTLGLTVMNALNTFQWTADNFTCRNVTASLDAVAINTDVNETPCTGAAIKPSVDAATAQKFKPAVRAGLAWEQSKDLTLTADVQSQFGSDTDAIIIGPKTSIGIGAEYRLLTFLPLRAGASAITGGSQFAGGAGLRIGTYELGVGAQLRTVNGVSTTNVMLGLVSIR